MRYWLGSVLHNCIAHPLIPFLPASWGDRFHDWTVQFMDGSPYYETEDEYVPTKIEKEDSL